MLSLLGTLALGVVVTPPAEANPGSPPVPTLDWQPCGEDLPGKLCATAMVPLDYDKPRGRTTELALAKMPASNPARASARSSSIRAVRATPGWTWSSPAMATSWRESRRPLRRGRLRSARSGRSDPLHCFDSPEELDAFFAASRSSRTAERQERPYFDQ